MSSRYRAVAASGSGCGPREFRDVRIDVVQAAAGDGQTLGPLDAVLDLRLALGQQALGFRLQLLTTPGATRTGG